MLARLRSNDRGAAAVEFALVAPILLLLVFGLIDFGRMLNAKISITEAAREGARAAAIERTSTSIDSRVALATSGIGGGGAAVESYTLCKANPAVGDDGKVTVKYKFQYITPVGAIAGLFGSGGSSWGDFDMRSSGVMPCRA